MTRLSIIVMLLALIAISSGLAGSGRSDDTAPVQAAEAGYALTTASEPAGQPDATASGSLARDLVSDDLAEALSTGGVVVLGVLGLVWVRRHVAAL